MTRILITGANGLLGQMLVHKILSMPDLQLLATSASFCKIKNLHASCYSLMDITSPQQVKDVFSRFKPEVVIHCAAITQVDLCEQDPDRCDRVNIEGTRLIAKAAENYGARLIYLSTDFVFDGLNGPYAEEDQPNPISIYGWSKLQGEYITRSLNVPWTIVRTVLLYGMVPSMTRDNLLTWVRNSLVKGQPIQVVDDQFRTPTLVDDLADGIIRIVETKQTGIFHLSGPEMTSILDFALRIARVFNLDASLISPIHSSDLKQPGKRPPSTGFVLNHAMEALDFNPKTLDQGLIWIQQSLPDFMHE